MKEYVVVSVEHLEQIKKWLQEREPVNAALALDEIIQHAPQTDKPAANEDLDKKIQFLVG